MRSLSFLLLALLLPVLTFAQPTPPADLKTPPADAERLENGLVMKVLKPGSGSERVGPADLARMRYTVWKSSGDLVQDVPAGKSMVVARSAMLPGWGAAVSEMAIGEVRRTWIPSSLSAGKVPEGDIMLIDTELIEIIRAPKAPADVAAPPADATKTESGLAYKLLHKGAGGASPKKSDTVVVHYSGWTTDGKMFDSSVTRGNTIAFPLTKVIKGWTEGLQLMSAGDKMRFWIPGELAYGNTSKGDGRPFGMLVFDIELIEVK